VHYSHAKGAKFWLSVVTELKNRGVQDIFGVMGYREYASDPQQCKHCPQRHQCTHSQNQTKVVTRHVWQDAKERIDAHRLEEKGKRLYARRKETVERSFADAKQLHGHRYARYRGLAKVRGQCLLAGACQNMKKMAMLLAKAFLRLIWRITAVKTAYLRTSGN